MSEHFELIVYTASVQQYADKVLDFIESKHHFFSYRLYKQHCIYKPSVYAFKSLDLFCMNRKIEDIIIVDNNVKNFALSINNGLPIREYKGAFNDNELIYLANYLCELVKEVDVRVKIKRDFDSFLFEHYNENK